MDALSLLSMGVGVALVYIGGIFDLLAAIGVNRFPDLYTRLHAITMGTIGGAVYPIIGCILIVLGYPGYSLNIKAAFIFPMIFISTLIIITAPTGSHAVARAALHKGYKPWRRGDEK